MSEFVKLRKEWAPREEQRPRMFWVQSSVLQTVYSVWSYPGSEQRDFFFFLISTDQVSPLLRSPSARNSHLSDLIPLAQCPTLSYLWFSCCHLSLLPVSWTEQICCYLQAFMLGVSSWRAGEFILPFLVTGKPWGSFLRQGVALVIV